MPRIVPDLLATVANYVLRNLPRWQSDEVDIGQPRVINVGDNLDAAIVGNTLTISTTTGPHNAITIGADAEHSLVDQVLSGVDAAAAQKGHISLGGELGGTAAAPTVDATHSGSAHHAAVTLAADADELLSLAGQAIGFDTQVANQVLAGPTAGAAADPDFRALVAADVPDLSASYDPAGTGHTEAAAHVAAAAASYDPAGTGHTEAAAHVAAHEGADSHPSYTTDAEADAIADGLIATHAGDDDAHHAKYTNAEAVAAVEAEATLDLAGNVTIAAAKTLAIDHIIEKTAAHGIVLDGVLLKDNLVYSGVDDTSAGRLYIYGHGSGNPDGGKINFYPAADYDAAFDFFTAGVDEDDWRIVHDSIIDFEIRDDHSIEIPSGALKVDHINEYTATHGIVLDGVELKDDAVETDAIRGLRETSGPTSLTVGTITDGEFLKRVGATIVSAAAGDGAAHAILDGSTHNDSVADTVSAGSIIIGNDTPKWDELVITVPGAANLLNVLGVATGETTPSYKVLFDATAPSAVGVASAGTGVVASRVNHVHSNTVILSWLFSGTCSVKTHEKKFKLPFATDFSDIKLLVLDGNEPTGAHLTVDIQTCTDDATWHSIFTAGSLPYINESEQEEEDNPHHAQDHTAYAADTYFICKITVIGSTAAGTGLGVDLMLTR